MGAHTKTLLTGYTAKMQLGHPMEKVEIMVGFG